MRKIEREMLEAVKNRKNWSLDNTRVIYHGPFSTIQLHYHTIAEWRHDEAFKNDPLLVNVQTLKQWPTNTTKSRLRALGANVTTKKGITYLDNKAIN